SSIRESSSDSEASESSIEIQTSPAPRGSITKEPFKGPAELEVTTPSNQMDVNQDISVINQRYKNVSPKERHKWRMPELPPVPKDVHGSRKDRKTSEGLQTHVLKRKSPTDKNLVENQSMLSEDQKKKLAQGKENSPVEAPQASTSAKHTPENTKDQPEGQAKGKSQVEQALPVELQDSQEREDSHGQCLQYGKNSDGI
ncbi:hypothetical protein O181_103026, partial [Austropuccinia psidii MF-1]|nr:hypothetical protein [Austropuccinia psidii MF-1]